MKICKIFITTFYTVVFPFFNSFAQFEISNIKIYQNQDSTLTFDKVSRPKYDTLFKSFEFEKLNYHVNKKYWIKFDYKQTDALQKYVLSPTKHKFNSIDLYFKIGNKTYHQTGGKSLLQSQRSIKGNAIILDLPIVTGQKTTCYAKVFAVRGFVLEVTPYPFNTIFEQNVALNSIDFFFFGIASLIVFFSLLMGVFMKDILYFYYLIFTAILMFSRAVDSGHIYTWGVFVNWNDIRDMHNLYSLGYVGITIFSILYTTEYLNIKSHNKSLLWFIYFLLVFRILLWIAHVYVYEINQSLSDSINSNKIDFSLMLFILTISIYYFVKKRELAIFSVGSTLLLTSASFIHVVNIGFLNIIGSSYATFMLFSSFEVVLFAAALVYRYYFLKNENEKSMLLAIEKVKENEALKDKVNKELEQLVQERTSEILKQAEEIEKINALLKLNNIKLENEVEDISKARVMNKSVTFEEFKLIFPDDDSCFSYLVNLKWSKGFECKKCKNNRFSIGNSQYSRRCSKCGHIESPTSETIFHKLKFPIPKAFYLLFLSTNSKHITLEQISSILDLRQATASMFRKKITDRISKNKLFKNTGLWSDLILD